MSEKNDIRVGIVTDIYRSANLLGRIGGKLATEAGLTSVQQWLLLRAIHQKGEAPLKDLIENTLVTKQNITGMITRLKQSGHVQTFPHPSDKRITLVKLTKSGVEALEKLGPIAKESNDKTFANFKEEELIALSVLLERLVATLEWQDPS